MYGHNTFAVKEISPNSALKKGNTYLTWLIDTDSQSTKY